MADGNGASEGTPLGAAGDNPPLAAMLLVGALFLLGLQDALVKLASSEVSLWQFQFVRSILNFVLLLTVMRLFWPGQRSKPIRPWAVMLRSALLCAAMIFFFSGVPFLTLAEIAAGLYVFPLFVALLSRVVLGERVGPRRIAAILVGFAGTLLILRPGTDQFTAVSLMPVAAAFCYGSTILVTRKLCRDESPVTLVYGVSLTFMAVGFLGLLIFAAAPFPNAAKVWPYLFTGWHAAELWVFGLIAVCSCLNVVSNISLAKAYQSAEASWLATFDYSYLVFATFWGYVMWRDVPDAQTFFGMAMIAAAGSFVAWREAKDKKTAEALERAAPR